MPLQIDPLAEDASLTFRTEDPSIASADAAGYVTGIHAGETVLYVTVTQYGRTDTFAGTITVLPAPAPEPTPPTDTTPMVDINTCVIRLMPSQFTYDGKSKTPTVHISYQETVLSSGTDYELSYSGNVHAGTAAVTITGKGSYTGKIRKTFVIQKATASITASSLTRTCSAKSQSFQLGATCASPVTYRSDTTSVKVNAKGKVTIKGSFIGAAVITITGASSDYSVKTKKITITVLPKTISLSSVKNASGKKITAKWKKDKTVTGYELQYSTKASFKSGSTLLAVKKNTTTSRTIKGLKKGRTYYVRLRSYKTVHGKKYVSGWSKSKKVTIKQ